ncbi:pericentriolar material 1 protein isoform X1 [Acipenser ruthenus]|uniref:pericentriolar material 1 protein isoform X1 n=1 Tax=Acipenser ruthenus TaxID=7906 RepID=UPI002741AF7B|nr:pericentriolar material 1 protein isoform X1 [Acipenser ruthenus]XP_058883057.1 pericentriolar material 1 protein isoform X1 [Acipenser ruthenus]XP_058883061.1 pericentriolar material 1 protein isoform X1 [Acipenser ruthenus]
MATGGAPFEEGVDDQDLPNWSISNGSLEDRLNNMDWGVQHKKANGSSEKNKKKFAVGAESRVTNDISPESSPGTGRRRTRTPHSFSHVKYATQMSVPEQAELERLKQRINFSDLDERSIGSDSQGRATAANNQRQFAENKKPFNFLPLYVNTNKSKEVALTPSKETTQQSSGKDLFASVLSKDSFQIEQMSQSEDGRGEPEIDSSQVVSKLVQIREYITKASSMRDDLVEKNEISANVDRLSHLIEHLKEQEKSYLKFLQKMLARENDEDEVCTIDSAVGSGSVAESTSLNIEVHSEASHATGSGPNHDAKEELENLKKQHDLLKKMLQQQEQLRALQGRQAALLAMQHKTEQAIAVMDDTVVTETTGSVSGLSITSELNEELNDLIQRFHNQLHDSQVKAVPDNRRQAESLSLTREASRSRNSSASEQLSVENARLVKLKELQDKKHTMDKILQELHTLRDQTLNNNSFPSQRSVGQRSIDSAASAPAGTTIAVSRESNSLSTAIRLDSTDSQNDSEGEDNVNPTEKLRKLKEVHKRLNELRELVHYYEQTSDMIVDTVNENTKDEDEETEESIFDSDQENLEPITNIRNPQRGGNWAEVNSLTNAQCGPNNRDGRLNTDCEINNRSATNLRGLNIPSVIECQYNRESAFNEEEGDDIDDDYKEDEGPEEEDQDDEGSESSVSSQRSDLEDDPEFVEKIHRLHTAKQKLRQLQELVAMVQDSDDDDLAISNASNAIEEDEGNQQPNNTRPNVPKTQKDVALKEKAREKLYEAKLHQQQEELQQLHDERQRLLEIQEKIQDLQWACPDLQLSVSSTMSQSVVKKLPAATSTPAVTQSGVTKPVQEPEEDSPADNELWSEMRRHQILREELRQRRKQLESLMAEHQRQNVLNDNTSKSEGTDAQGSQQMSRNERTMATWGGSTQCALHDDADALEHDEGGFLSEDAVQEEEEEEEEQGDTILNENFPVYSRSQRPFTTRKARDSNWRRHHQFSVDGDIRTSAKSNQQQNVSMRRQENLRWASDLSFVEETEPWQEQINKLKKQLDFSTSMCQTLMQDQQTLSYMLQTLLTSPYSILPNNVGSPQVHLIMHQLNQCYTQLAWQQSNVQRLKQMLNDLLRQQQLQQTQQSVGQDPCLCPPSPNVVFPFNFLPPLNSMNMPGLAQFSPMSAGFNFNPVFPPGFGDFYQNAATKTSEQQQQADHNTSAKTEYMAFPKPFESSSLNMTENKWQQKETKDGAEQQGAAWMDGGKTEEHLSSHIGKVMLGLKTNIRQQAAGSGRQFDQESLESFSSMPDPMDPTTVTETFKSRKASAQASLASKDKTPKSKSRRRNKGQGKNPRADGIGQDSASVSSASDYKERGLHGKQTEQSGEALDKLTHDKLGKKLSKSNDLSSAHVWRAPFHSNRNACTEAPETGSDFSMFEALRDTIYSEVATLISQNESRPHFLIELFHELQMLKTDYLRQRALYALQDIAARHLSENKDTNEETAVSLSSAAWAASNSELTQSESLATSDAEVSEKSIESKSRLNRKQNEGDGEFLDNASILSTTSNLEPFANDDLGNTVIHLDKALARIREYERMKLQAEYNRNAADSSAAEQGAAESLEGVCRRRSIAGHVSSDIPCPRIDTQQLDRQIKAIMTEVIPFLKEHMEDVCSSQLLTSIRRMVLTLTQQNDESKEFVRFFHKQLGGILQDSLTKFAGRTLKECGEDLLVEISEILFNELAFFRLMQDLDNSSAIKQKCKNKMEPTTVKPTLNPEENKLLEGEQSFTGDFEDEDKDKDETEQNPVIESEINETAEVKENMSCNTSDREEEEEDDEDDDSEGLPVSISLSKAETQALTNYGSGEDENEDEELEEFETEPVEVQTSLQASNETADENEQEQATNVKSQNVTQTDRSEQDSIDSTEAKNNVTAVTEPIDGNSKELNESGADAASAAAKNEVTTEEVVPSLPLIEGTVADTAPMQMDTGSATLTPESSLACSPDTDSPVMIDYEAGSGNLSQKSDEEDFVKLEDLPLQLSVLCEDELLKRIAEQENNHSTPEINGSGDGPQGLAGNAQILKEPEIIGAQSA